MSSEAARAWAEALAPVTAAILELARPLPGERVLDLGAGAGQLALEIAAVVGPRGTVLATDPAADAVAAIRRIAASGGLGTAVQALCVAAEALDPGIGRFDLVVARNSVMYFEDLGRGLGNALRVLGRGGRLVASVYGTLDQEPFHAIPLAAVRRHVTLSRPLPEYAAAFDRGADDVEAALLACGARSVARRAVPVRRSFASLDSLRTALRESSSLAELLGRVPLAAREKAWREIDAAFERYAGASGVVVPGLQVVLVAQA